MYDKKSLSIQVEEILMEQIKTYPCLYNKSKMSYKERDVKRNAWSKVAESWILYKTICTNVEVKNLLCISSDKESKS